MARKGLWRSDEVALGAVLEPVVVVVVVLAPLLELVGRGFALTAEGEVDELDAA